MLSIVFWSDFTIGTNIALKIKFFSVKQPQSLVIWWVLLCAEIGCSKIRKQTGKNTRVFKMFQHFYIILALDKLSFGRLFNMCIESQKIFSGNKNIDFFFQEVSLSWKCPSENCPTREITHRKNATLAKVFPGNCLPTKLCPSAAGEGSEICPHGCGACSEGCEILNNSRFQSGGTKD